MSYETRSSGARGGRRRRSVALHRRCCSAARSFKDFGAGSLVCERRSRAGGAAAVVARAERRVFGWRDRPNRGAASHERGPTSSRVSTPYSPSIRSCTTCAQVQGRTKRTVPSLHDDVSISTPNSLPRSGAKESEVYINPNSLPRRGAEESDAPTSINPNSISIGGMRAVGSARDGMRNEIVVGRRWGSRAFIYLSIAPRLERQRSTTARSSSRRRRRRRRRR